MRLIAMRHAEEQRKKDAEERTEAMNRELNELLEIVRKAEGRDGLMMDRPLGWWENLCRAALAGEWRPIETAPKINYEVILGYAEEAGNYYLVHWEQEEDAWFLTGQEVELADGILTHWQPLPQPPKGEVKP